MPSLEVEPAEQAANKSYGRWLPTITGRAPISLKAAGLWMTHNGSIVAVSRRPNGQWGATVPVEDTSCLIWLAPAQARTTLSPSVAPLPGRSKEVRRGARIDRLMRQSALMRDK